jgi:menaquinone-dependent protoporphyrinogen oxidase
MPDCQEDAPKVRRPRIVIVTASKHGSTIAIAGAIAQEMSAHGATAIVCEPSDDVEFDGADGVIIGSAVYLGRWMRAARRLVKRHAPELGALPVWLFSSGPVADEPEPGLDPSELERLMSRSGAIGHREFGGRLDMDSLGPIETLIATGVGVTDADHRDWSEVRSWAQSILQAVTASEQGSVVGTEDQPHNR